jgi:hypothetical protein
MVVGTATEAFMAPPNRGKRKDRSDPKQETEHAERSSDDRVTIHELRLAA